ncbi:murein hydrolase activator EnvC family protein [Ruminococcus sp.]|uniref:murein hydrolase activator EnvC family protein n=1 Tax=Ruminococcus sp. TaxID=41978 RepID=UPI0038679718
MKKLLSACLALIMILGGAVSTAAATISELEARQAELESQQAEYQAKLNKSNSAVAEKQEEVDALVGQVESVTAEIQVCYQKISIYDKNIAEKQKAIDEANAEIDSNMNTLRQRIKTIYISGDVSALEIVMGAKDFTDFLDKLQLVQYVSEHDAELINGIKKKLETISEEKKALEADKAKLEEEHTTLTTKQDELTKLLDENKETLASLQSEANDAQMKLELSEEELSKLKPEIQELIRQSQAAAASQQSAASSSDGTEEISYSDNSSGSASYSSDAPSHIDSGDGWTWPIPGCYTITGGYGEGRSYESHGGTDIAASIGTPIYAANSGTVLYTSNDCTHSSAGVGGCNHGGGYGNHVWIQHDNGYQTIYGHMISTAVSPGEYVSKGQLIGYSGSTGWSTGPHLHFELRINGVRSNPMALFPSFG